MRLFKRSAEAPPPAVADEDPVVRQYRYLLRTAPLDALEHAHREALTSVGPQDRVVVLQTVQQELVTGMRLQPDDVPALARLVVLGERRSPGALLRHCEAGVLRRLADAALVSQAAFGLLTGYAAWDGGEPEPAPEEEWEARRHRNWSSPADHADGGSYRDYYGANYTGGGDGGG